MVSPETLPLRIAIVIAIGCMMAAGFMLAACGSDHQSTSGADAAVDPDPLDVANNTPAPGSLDDIHQSIIAKRCSGQPGLCHNGQFEPNLSTPAMTYAYLVARPGIEHPTQLRVKPSDPANSLFIDKVRNRNVATQMPLGAEPLEEADIQALEGWITSGALRSPGAQADPILNNPPKRPEIAIYNGTTRLDGAGPVSIPAGTSIIIRHSVSDFETPDASIPFAGIVMIAADGRNVVLNPTASDKTFGQTTYDAAGPMGQGDQLDYRFNYTIPASLPLLDKATGIVTNVTAKGQVVSIIAVYIDQATMGIAAFDTGKSPINIQ